MTARQIYRVIRDVRDILGYLFAATKGFCDVSPLGVSIDVGCCYEKQEAGNESTQKGCVSGIC